MWNLRDLVSNSRQQDTAVETLRRIGCGKIDHEGRIPGELRIGQSVPRYRAGRCEFVRVINAVRATCQSGERNRWRRSTEHANSDKVVGVVDETVVVVRTTKSNRHQPRSISCNIRL